MKPNDDDMVSDTYVFEDTLKALAASLLSSMLQAVRWNNRPSNSLHYSKLSVTKEGWTFR